MSASSAERERLLFIAPTMPSNTGNGLAMRAGFFLDAYFRHFDIDLVVAPIAGSATPSPFVRERVRRVEILRLDQPDTEFRLLNTIRDPATQLAAFRRYGRPSLTAFNNSLCAGLVSAVGDTRYRAIHVFRLYLAELATHLVKGRSSRCELVIDCDEDDAIHIPPDRVDASQP